MKKVLYIFSLIGLLAFSSCADELNTEPTDKVSGSTIFADASSAETAINGVYRMLYVAGWSSNWGLRKLRTDSYPIAWRSDG